MFPSDSPRQLLLDIRPNQAPSFENFIVGDNAEACARLAAMAAPRAYDLVYIWGEPGSGRSHLLSATWAAAAHTQRCAQLVTGAQLTDGLPLPPGCLVIVDDVDQLGPTAQISLFRTFNSAPLAGLSLLMAGHEPPLRLPVREDLRTRIGSALIYEIKPLSDEQKAEALRRHAEQRGIRLDDAVLDYLLRRGRRDFSSLMAMLDALDRTSLEQQRPITLPLLRQLMQLPSDDADS